MENANIAFFQHHYGVLKHFTMASYGSYLGCNGTNSGVEDYKYVPLPWHQYQLYVCNGKKKISWQAFLDQHLRNENNKTLGYEMNKTLVIYFTSASTGMKREYCTCTSTVAVKEKQTELASLSYLAKSQAGGWKISFTAIMSCLQLLDYCH